MLVLLLHESIGEVVWDHCLDPLAVLPVQRVVFAVAVVVHVMGADVASDLGLFVHSFESFSFGVAIVLQGNWIVGESVGIGNPLYTHYLVDSTELISFFDFILLIFNLLPSLILPL